MAKIIAGIGTSHVPSVGVAFDKGEQETTQWKPLFDAYKPVQNWLGDIKPDVAIMVYNDHGTDFFFDKYPTFAIGVSERYGIGDEGYGIRPLPPLKGDPDFSWHLCEWLVYHEFDITICQDMKMDHGILVPMNLFWSHEPDWPVPVVPVQVNVLQHPLPTAMRCFKLGQAIRKAVEAYDKDMKVVIVGTGGMSHQLEGERFGFLNQEWDQQFLDLIEKDPARLAQLSHQTMMEQGGAESVELIMWLIMRGALSAQVTRIHRNYYAPMTTGMGLVTMKDAG